MENLGIEINENEIAENENLPVKESHGSESENMLLSEFKSFSESFAESTDNQGKSSDFEEAEESQIDDSNLIESSNTSTISQVDKDTLSQGLALLFCYLAPIVVCYGYEYFAKKVVSNEARKAIEFTKREQSDISDALEKTLEYYGRIKSENPLTSLILLIVGVLASKIFILSTMEKEVIADKVETYKQFKESENSEVVLRKSKPVSKKRVITCKKCGETGHNSATCCKK